MNESEEFNFDSLQEAQGGSIIEMPPLSESPKIIYQPCKKHPQQDFLIKRVRKQSQFNSIEEEKKSSDHSQIPQKQANAQFQSLMTMCMGASKRGDSGGQKNNRDQSVDGVISPKHLVADQRRQQQSNPFGLNQEQRKTKVPQSHQNIFNFDSQLSESEGEEESKSQMSQISNCKPSNLQDQDLAPSITGVRVSLDNLCQTPREQATKADEESKSPGEVLLCECHLCNKQVKMDQLDEHEQMCENLKSRLHINEILEEEKKSNFSASNRFQTWQKHPLEQGTTNSVKCQLCQQMFRSDSLRREHVREAHKGASSKNMVDQINALQQQTSKNNSFRVHPFNQNQQFQKTTRPLGAVPQPNHQIQQQQNRAGGPHQHPVHLPKLPSLNYTSEGSFSLGMDEVQSTPFPIIQNQNQQRQNKQTMHLCGNQRYDSINQENASFNNLEETKQTKPRDNELMRNQPKSKIGISRISSEEILCNLSRPQANHNSYLSPFNDDNEEENQSQSSGKYRIDRNRVQMRNGSKKTVSVNNRSSSLEMLDSLSQETAKVSDNLMNQNFDSHQSRGLHNQRTKPISQRYLFAEHQEGEIRGDYNPHYPSDSDEEAEQDNDTQQIVCGQGFHHSGFQNEGFRGLDIVNPYFQRDEQEDELSNSSGPQTRQHNMFNLDSEGRSDSPQSVNESYESNELGSEVHTEQNHNAFIYMRPSPYSQVEEEPNHQLGRLQFNNPRSGGLLNNLLRQNININDSLQHTLDSHDSDEENEEEGHLYRHGIVAARQSFNNYEDMLRLDEGIVQSVPKKMIDMLPLSTFIEANLQNFSDENKACTICMCIYEQGEQYIILPCLHRFHKQCICTWFERKNTCPNCKDKVVAHFNEQIVQIRSSTAQVPIPAQNINNLNPFSDVLDDREEYLQRMNRGNPSNFRISHQQFNEQWRSIPRPAIQFSESWEVSEGGSSQSISRSQSLADMQAQENLSSQNSGLRE